MQLVNQTLNNSDNDNNENEYVIDNEYVMYAKMKLGNGHFGHTFKGISIKSKIEYAIKIEQNDTLAPQLESEYNILKELRGQPGLPNVYYYKDHGQDKTLVMDLLGPNLEVVMKNTKKKVFSMKTVLMIGDQLLNIINCIHDREVIHRDLKPENMAIGMHLKQNSIFLIDFGLSNKYINNKTNEHIPYKDKKQFTGTPMFASIYTHLGIEQSRRDDLETLGYILVYYVVGALPWQKIKSKSQEEKHEKILESKCNCRDKCLLAKDLPEEFQMYFDNVFKLGFTELPNYIYLRGLLNNAMSKLGFYSDNIFDWMCEDLNEYPVFKIREMKEKEENLNIVKIEQENIKKSNDKMNTQNQSNNKISIGSVRKEDENKKENRQSLPIKRKDGIKKIVETPLRYSYNKKTSK